MYYVYDRTTSSLVTKVIFGAEILLTMFSPDKFEVVIVN